MAKKQSRTLKHPVLKNVEYGYITKNKKKVLEFEGIEVENKKWIEFQRYLGEKLGTGKFFFTIKFKNDPTLFTGHTTTAGVIEKMDDSSKDLLVKFDELKKVISSKTDGVSTDLLLSVTKQSYETHINFLNNQINKLEKDLRDLESECEALADDCVNYETEIQKLSSKSDYLPLAEKALLFMQTKFGTVGKAATLENSDPSDIPGEILQILGTVDYVKLQSDEAAYQKIVNGLRQYISLLPQKD